jgi:hypothetical protein
MAKDYELAAQGKQAERILSDEIYRGAVEQVSLDLFEAWKSTSWHQILKREFIYRQYKAIGEVETRLRAVMENGKFAQQVINKET